MSSGHPDTRAHLQDSQKYTQTAWSRIPPTDFQEWRPMTKSSSTRDKLATQRKAYEAWNPHTNAMMAMSFDAAETDAANADAEAAAGRWQGILHGMTLAVKDNIDTAGIETTHGSLFFKGRVPNANAHVIDKLKRAGAIVVGKATLHEFAFGVRSYNPVIGQARNPYDLERIPGGSSGGSGIAVATGMADAALGTDTGGSVRIPSSINGITGLRPTVGRISNRGTYPVSATHDTIGPMARSATDVARLFAVMAGYDDADPVSRNEPLENFLPRLHDGIEGIRIGIPANYYYDDLDADVASAMDAARETFEKLGARLTSIALPGAENALQQLVVMIYSDACQVHADRIEGNDESWGQQTIERMRMALDYSSRDYAAAMRAKEAWQRTLANTFDTVDMILTPTLPALPPPIDDNRSLYEATTRVAANTYAGALGSIPGLSAPCGISRSGLPIGLQLETRWWNEPLLLRAACAFQAHTDWHLRRPKLPG
jgi:aspartyl-tRNA(Asn)/glutamyl-tRNA(Gln) amidotransferase subunit A